MKRSALTIICLTTIGFAITAQADTTLFQDDAEKIAAGQPVKAVVGEYEPGTSIFQAVKAGQETHPKSPAKGASLFRIDAPAAVGTKTVGKLSRMVNKGEVIRLQLDIRLDAGEHLQFGFANAAAPFLAGVSLEKDGSVASRVGDGYAVIPDPKRGKITHTVGGWQRLRLEYVVGADRLTISSDKGQIFVMLPAPLETIDRIRIDAGSDATVGYVDNLLVQAMLDPAIEALPVFGRVDWDLQEIPFIDPGPVGGISGAAMVAAGKSVYLMGGFIPGGDKTKDIDRKTSRWSHRYDPALRKWEPALNLPERREYLRGAEAEGVIYAIGGGKQGPYASKADVFAWNTLQPNATWMPLAALSIPRTHLAVARVGNQLIAAGGNEYDAKEEGYSAKTMRSTTEVLDLASPHAGWKQATPFPGLPRGWSAAAGVDGKMYVIGGLTWVDDAGKKVKTWTPETLIYDPQTDQWSKGNSPPVAGSGWAAAVYQDRYIVLLGGVRNIPLGTKYYEFNVDPLLYDTKDNRWLRIERGAMPPGGVFNDPGVAIVGDEIFAVGGEGPGSHYPFLLTGRITPAAAVTKK